MRSEPTVSSHAGSEGRVERPVVADAGEVFDHVRDVLGHKWHLRIVSRLLVDGPKGFSALKREIDGVSSKMLSESLSRLQREGVLDRTVRNEHPVRVEYSLTKRGRALEAPVSALVRWGETLDANSDVDAGSGSGSGSDGAS